MRETFPREAAANPEPFTGERLTASIHGQVEVEHYHRYLYARIFCRDRDVLDVASGEGYGAAQLAQVASQVVGVEYAGPTARNAAANFAQPNLRFVRGDARTLPLAEASFDVVTSFETIEHFDRQEEFVAEVRRVLRPDGCFIVSTPDRVVYTRPGQPANPFHVREFDRYEFLDLLHRHFRYVTLIRQRAMVASVLVPEETASIAPLIFEQCADGGFAAEFSLPNAPYLVAIASEHTPRLTPVSLLIEPSDIDNFRVEDQEAELTRLRASEAAARERVAQVLASEAAARAEAEAEARRVAEAAQTEATRLVDQARADAAAAAATLTHTRAALVQANNELDRIGGSARHFLLQYIPRLWRQIGR